MGESKTFSFKDGILESKDFPLNEVSEMLASEKKTVYVDLTYPNETDLQSLADELDLHDLAVEDALHSLQRPKIDYYPDHLFMACHTLKLDNETGELHVAEVDIFVKGNCIITVHKEDFDPSEFESRWQNTKEPIDVSFLLYSLLDVIIDQYLDTVTRFDDYYDEISETIFSGEYVDIAREKKWFNMRRSLVHFHRVMISVREAINVLLRRENHFLNDELVPYFYDLHDHLVRVSESTDVLRELVATIIETNVNMRDYRQNQIVKQVTSWAAIVAVPTLVTGYYGMNVPFPGSGQTSGVLVSSGLAFGTSFFLFKLFRRRDWL